MKFEKLLCFAVAVSSMASGQLGSPRPIEELRYGEKTSGSMDGVGSRISDFERGRVVEFDRGSGVRVDGNSTGQEMDEEDRPSTPRWPYVAGGLAGWRFWQRWGCG